MNRASWGEKLSISETAKSMKSRIPWPVAQKIFAVNEVGRSQGWDKTVEKLTKHGNFPQNKAEALELALKEHILVGEKISTFYEVDDQSIEKLRESLANAKVPESTYRAVYPNSLSDNQLDAEKFGLTLVAIEQNDDGIGAVFSSVRVLTSREPLEASDFPPEAAHLFDDFDEIVGMKITRVQAFDVIWVPSIGNHVEVRIDYPRGAQQDVSAAALVNALKEFHSIVGSDILHEKVNLFPLIDRMYFDSIEGSVVEIGFGTTTASLKHEKMRRKGLSLRNEKYHKGGSAALQTPIQPFRLSIVWKRQIDQDLFSTPELSLHSTSRASMSTNPIMTSVIIQKCMGLDDYQFVRSRIAHHLKPVST